MRKQTLIILLSGLLVGASVSSMAPGADSKTNDLILSTTTSTQDSGLLDVLVPIFEEQTGYRLKTISVGTGQALRLAAKGDADVALVHAPNLEKKFLAAGTLRTRRLVMHNHFIIVGPDNDPAKVASVKSACSALQRIARARARFVSRGDNSGTHNLEKSLWRQADLVPGSTWYMESGQGMGATLRIANEKDAYTITDRATYLALKNRLTLPILLQGDKLLLNIYSVIEVNPANGARINTAGGRAFAEFMVAPPTQAIIKNFGREKFGQPLFVPIAGKREDEIGG